MRIAKPVHARRASAAICGFLFCVAALTAAADYDSSALDGNLQNQCTNFDISQDYSTTFIIEAECNQSGSTSRVSTTFDLQDHVRWNQSTKVLSWDTTITLLNFYISSRCRPDGTSPFTISSSDVTLALTCIALFNDDTGQFDTESVSLALNGNLQADTTSGELSRR